jgi:hypothetical protein
MIDFGGISWLLVDVVFVLVLGLAMAYATFGYFRRDRRLDQWSGPATKALYDQMDRAQLAAAVRDSGWLEPRTLAVLVLLLVCSAGALVLYLGVAPR